jgi:hypothetical protein
LRNKNKLCYGFLEVATHGNREIEGIFVNKFRPIKNLAFIINDKIETLIIIIEINLIIRKITVKIK